MAIECCLETNDVDVDSSLRLEMEGLRMESEELLSELKKY
jgi:hypothetical protein